MRRIDMVKNKTMRNVRVQVLDKKRIKLTFSKNESIVLVAKNENYGTDSGIYIEVDNVEE